MRSPQEFFKELGTYGLPTDPKEYGATDTGQIYTDIQQNDVGYQPSRREVEAWKDGRVILYNATHTVTYSLIVRQVPDSNTTAKVLNVRG